VNKTAIVSAWEGEETRPQGRARSIPAVRLHPDPAITGGAWSIGLLGNGTFEAGLAGLPTKTGAVTGNVFAVAQTAGAQVCHAPSCGVVREPVRFFVLDIRGVLERTHRVAFCIAIEVVP
jgi:hypothetical protein